MKKTKQMLSCTLMAALMTALLPVSAVTVRAEETQERKFMVKDVGEEGKWLGDMYTDKSMYQPGDTAIVTVELNHKGEAAEAQLSAMALTLELRHLGKLVLSSEVLLNNTGSTVQVPLTLPDADFTGYSLEAYLWGNSGLTDYRMSAVDVSSDWNVFPRYAYITKLDHRRDEEINEALDRLKKHHINGLFYYDVFDAQEKPLAGSPEAPDAQWKSLAGQTVAGESLLKTIEGGHERKMNSFFYNLIFGAYDGYEEKGIRPEWGLYKDGRHEEQDVHDLGGSGWETEKLWMFNPANTEWQEHFVQVHKDFLSVYPFDGLQMDSLGNRNAPRYDYYGNEIELDQTYAPFLKKLEEGLDTRILFNPVGGYGLQQMLNSGCFDMAYIEVWPGDCKDYLSLKKVQDQIYAVTEGNKGSVIAAYMDYDVMKGEPFNLPGILYTDAMLMASGSSHLELGDTGMLSNEYYPGNSLRISAELGKRLRNYYSFMTAYENCLRGPGLKEKKGIRTSIDGKAASDEAELGNVFAFMKKKENLQILHLINFDGASSSAWVDSRGVQTPPKIKQNVTVVQSVDREPEHIWLASPDYRQGIMEELDFTYKDGSVTFNLPYLEYWDMVVME